MPTFDGGHYFLTVLLPIRTDVLKDEGTATSPVHALRKRLDVLAPAAQTPASDGKQSPFARSLRTHFARFAIIDDVAYNGRDGRNVIAVTVTNEILTNAQPQDHLTCPFLLFVADFDAKSGADAERDSYVKELWNTMQEDLCQIFGFCQRFDPKKMDAEKFAKYISDCQIETTMSFNDYYADTPALPVWSTKPYLWFGGGSAVAMGLGFLATLLLLVLDLFTPFLQGGLRCAFASFLIGAVVLAVVLLLAYRSANAFGAKPFPTAPNSDLPTVLKALHLRNAFTRFAVDNQMQAAGGDADSAKQLYDNFAAFVAANKPSEVGEPTQKPGVIGI
jgi:hypothetical protein